MTEKEYNLKIIMFFSLIIISIVSLAIILIKEGKTSGWLKTHFLVYKYVVIIISLIVCVGLLLYMVSGVAYNVGGTSEVQIVDVVHNGSYAGLMDYYSFYVKFPDGNNSWISTPLFASQELKEQAELLKTGDLITIRYVSKIQSVYFIKKTETQTGQSGDGSLVSDEPNT